MAKKIFLSPSNQTDNRYAYGNTTEAIQCGKIAAAAEKALKRCGFEVKLVHMESMYDKVPIAESWGADLYIPIHTNAFNGKVGGTRVFYYNENSKGYAAAKCIYKYLKPLTLGTSDNITPNPDLYEIERPSIPTVYVEAEFHDNPTYAKWIIEHITEIAEAICKGVCEYYGVMYVAEPEAANKPLYRVQVGAYANRENAERMLKQLRAQGYTDAFIKQG